MNQQESSLPPLKHKNNRLSLYCEEKFDKNNNRFLACTKSEPSENISNEYENIINDPFIPIRESTKNPSSSIGIVILATIIGGFGFAIAYFILYILYDYMSIPNYTFDWAKTLISFGILVLILLGLVLITYAIYHQNSKKEQ